MNGTAQTTILTVARFREIAPNLSAPRARLYLTHLMAAAAEYSIDSPVRLAAWLAQLAHETDSFKYLQEIWGPTPAQRRYEPPSDLARTLGNTKPGDGKRFKGRGFVMITGRDNYRKFGALLGLDLEGDPEQAAQPAIAARIAGAYWKNKRLNEPADAGDFETITRRINGGMNGWESRLEYWARAKRVLGISEKGVSDGG